MKKFLILISILALAGAGCTPRTVVDDQGGGTTPEGQATEETRTVEPITEDVSSTDISSSDDARLSQISDRYRTSADGVPEFGDVLFEYDSYSIGSEYRKVLDDLSSWLINNNAILLVEGHCDDRGTREYNLALGDRRSLSIKDYLLASGVPDLKLETVSYGEERPTCRQETESCWGQNRRGHFVIEVVR